MNNVVILVLKTETYIICEIQEVFEGTDENRKGICVLMINPYKLSLIQNDDSNIQVRFDKWCPYSVNSEYRISYDSIMAVGECDPSLKEAYLSKIEETNSNNVEETNE